jgi:hypothetical protein
VGWVGSCSAGVGQIIYVYMYAHGILNMMTGEHKKGGTDFRPNRGLSSPPENRCELGGKKVLASAPKAGTFGVTKLRYGECCVGTSNVNGEALES